MKHQQTNLPLDIYCFCCFRYICIKYPIYYRTNVTVIRMRNAVVVVWVAITLYLSTLLTLGRQELTHMSCSWEDLFNLLVEFLNINFTSM